MFATSFTVIIFSRQHFGQQSDVYNWVEPDAEFVGLTKDFSFDCPGVASGETAVLMFQSFGVASQETVLQINAVDVYGGIPVSNHRGVKPQFAVDWSANVMLVESNHQLKAAGNMLHVESTGLEFIIDNVVITYKTTDLTLTGPFRPFAGLLRFLFSGGKRSTRD